MSKRTEFLLLLIALSPLLARTCLSGETEMKPDFYVAASGNDSNPGTRDKPFATPLKARDAVRKAIAAGLTHDVTVLIGGGFYELSAPLALGPEDSGSEKFSITYAASPGEKPVLSGGQRITGWKRGDDNVWTVNLPDVKAGTWNFRQLFVDGQRAQRSRFPKAGKWLRVGSCSPDFKTLGFSETLPAADLGGKDVELLMLQNWSVSRALVASSTANQIVSATPIGWIGHGIMTCASPGKSMCLENGRLFLDQPGEWCLERASGTLSYKAGEGEDPNRMVIVAPRAEHLVTVEGRKDKPVRNVKFSGLAFEHTEFPLPPFGYSEIQAGHYSPSTKEASHVPPVALEFMYASECSIERCRIAHAGSAGIGFGAGCKRNTVVGCEITDIGGNGVMVGWRGKGAFQGPESALDRDWQDASDTPSENDVSNNLIARCGALSHGSVAVYVAFSADTKVTHNEIRDLPYTGISVGFRWSPTPSSQVRALVAYNHIHNAMNLLADGGGIYTLGVQPGTVFRGNLIHDIHRAQFAVGAPNNGFFIDESSAGFLFEKNVVYGAADGPIRYNTGGPDKHTHKDNQYDTARGQATSTPGRVGGAILLAGNSSKDFPGSADLDAPELTVEAWIKAPAYPQGPDDRRWLVAKNGNEWDESHYALMIKGKDIGAYLNIGGGQGNAIDLWSTNGPLKLDTWHHAALTYDGKNLTVYLDGAAVGTKAVNRPRKAGSSALFIGGRPDHFGYFGGALDEVRVYKRALTAPEIAAHFRAPEKIEKDKDLAGYWGFNDEKFEAAPGNAGLEPPFLNLMNAGK